MNIYVQVILCCYYKSRTSKELLLLMPYFAGISTM
jgi:hypothetical protein